MRCLSPRRIRPALSVGLWLVLATPGWAELLHCKNGRTLDGLVESETDSTYRVRLMHGVIELPKDEVARREPLDPPWERLKAARGRFPQTAQGRYDFALWCRENGFVGEMRAALRACVELDPEFEPARRELGHVRDGNRWVERPRPSPPKLSPQDQARKDEEEAVRREITRWVTRIRGIRSNKLDRTGRDESSELFQAGRRQLLQITDVLAIPAIASVLSGGGEPTRRLMVEVLAKFPQDEATLNLVAIALLDPSPDVRRRAGEALRPRKDERVVAELRAALGSEEETLLRNAAVALGLIGAIEAVPDLLPLLEVSGFADVVITRPNLITGLWQCFCGPSVVLVGGVPLFYYPPAIAVLTPGTVVGAYWTTEIQRMALYRTEVQEALITITGQNFGFDIAAWERWWQQQPRR